MSTPGYDLLAAAPTAPDAQRALLHFAVSNSRAVFYIADLEGERRVHFISSNLEDVTGRAASDLLAGAGRYGWDHVHPEDMAAWERGLAELRAGGWAVCEYRFRGADGRWLWFRDELSLLPPDRNPGGDGTLQFVGCMLDVTAEKQTEVQLREAERLNAAIIGTVQNAIVAMDDAGRIIEFNPAAERIFGYPREGVVGRPLSELIIPPRYRERHEAGMRRFRETGEIRMMDRRVEIEAMRADGGVFPVELSITRAFLGGQCVFVAEITDISERRAAEVEHRRLSRLLDDAVESLPNGFAVADAEGRLTLCNRAFAATYGLEPEAMFGSLRVDNVRRLLPRVRRFDGEAVSGSEEQVERISARLLRTDHDPAEIELLDGQWLLISSSPTSDGGNVYIRTDITRQKRAEIALRESEEHFRQMVEHHPLPVFLADLESGEVIYESPALSALMGPAGPRARSFAGEEIYVDPADKALLIDMLRHGGEIRGHEVRIRRSDGGLSWVSVSGRLFPHKGRRRVIGSFVDLSDRRIAEEALRESEIRYRTLVENAPVCIHEVDLDGRIRSMNPRGLEMLGKQDRTAVEGHPYLDFVGHRDRDRVADALRAAMAGERVQFEFSAGGGTRHYMSTKIPFPGERGVIEKLVGITVDITERKRHEAELRQARETLEDAIEALPQGFAIWDAEDRLVMCNEHFREFNRLCADVLAPGIPWREYMHVAIARGQYPEITGDVDEWLDGLRQELEVAGVSREFHQADGRWFQAFARRTRQGGLVGIRSDITRRKQMEEALRDNEALVRQVLDASPVPIQMTRVADGRVLYESPATRLQFRIPEDGPEDRKERSALERWTSREERDAYLALLRAHGEVEDHEIHFRRADGSIFPGSISARLISYKGEDVVVSSTYDLTERYAVQSEMERQREALHQSEKLGAMGQLLASVAHELNNPLSVVVGQALLLRETAGDERIAGRATKIGNAADRCARIVKTFLAMARQQPTEMTAVNLNDIVETMLEVTGYALRSHDIDVRLWLTRNLPPVWGDADQLNQVLTNLLMNAQQALQEKDGRRRVKITTSWRPQSGEVVLKVKDNGPGIPPGIRTRIFEPFFTTKDVGSGTGIGLAVCHRVVDAHGGSIKVESVPGGWTSFMVRLPASAAALPSRAAEEEAAGAADRGLSVLVIDDEQDVADVIAEILSGDGHRVEIAHSGHAALDRIAAHDFDVILSDLRMPGLDGPGFHRLLCERRPELCPRVAFITGDTLSPNARDFLAASGCPHIEKPVTPQELRGLIRRLREPGGA